MFTARFALLSFAARSLLRTPISRRAWLLERFLLRRACPKHLHFAAPAAPNILMMMTRYKIFCYALSRLLFHLFARSWAWPHRHFASCHCCHALSFQLLLSAFAAWLRRCSRCATAGRYRARRSVYVHGFPRHAWHAHRRDDFADAVFHRYNLLSSTERCEMNLTCHDDVHFSLSESLKLFFSPISFLIFFKRGGMMCRRLTPTHAAQSAIFRKFRRFDGDILRVWRFILPHDR